MKILIRVGLLLVLFSAAGLIAGALSPEASSEPSGDGPVDQFLGSEDRLGALGQAHIYTPRRVDQVDLFAGPQAADAFNYPFEAEVHCDFVMAGSEMGGATNKFLCEVTEVRDPRTGRVQKSETGSVAPEVVKVKFNNREAVSEIASTRLLWALGFAADATFGVTVVCHGCPADPASGGGEPGTHRFEGAAVERRVDGVYMKDAVGEEGWTWEEFVDHSRLPLAQVDGFKMIAAFLMHSDSKKEQQSLLCADTAVDDSADPPALKCSDPRLMISDAGATFGGGGRMTSSDAKMDLGAWAKKEVWKEEVTEEGRPACRAYLLKSWTAGGGLKHPRISEEGRYFASRLLCALSDRQLHDLFRAARVWLLEENRDPDGTLRDGLTPDKIVAEWVAEFKRRRQDLAGARCSAVSLAAAPLPGIPDLFQQLPNQCSGSTLDSPERPTLTPAEITEPFLVRVREYAALKSREQRQLGPLGKEATPEAITAHKQTLQKLLAARRHALEPGHLFTPLAAVYFRQLIAAHLSQPAIRELVADVKETGATGIDLEVNAPYPPGKPLSTMPPELLEALPELPEGLQYRLVDRHLMLLDADAGMVVDFVLHAVP